jgi:translation initiation factor IF-3
MNLKEALRKAQERGLDLVQITDKVKPPVCKLINYGKYLYQQKKKEKKKGRGGEVKGIRLRFNISEHDIKIKAKQAGRFLEQGKKIKIEMVLRGREKALRDHAKEKINKFLEALKENASFEIEKDLTKSPSGFNLIIKK